MVSYSKDLIATRMLVTRDGELYSLVPFQGPFPQEQREAPGHEILLRQLSDQILHRRRQGEGKGTEGAL